MESAGIPLDIIVYALIAGAMVIILRNVLGSRHGSERQRPNPFAGQSGTDKPISAEPAKLDGVTGNVDAGLVQISIADRTFDARQFVDNAKEAFAIVVSAFAEGDKNTLDDLLAPDVYKSFAAEIDRRASAGQKAITEVHSIRKADVIAASLQKTKAFVTVRFVASETYVLTDKDGKTIAGNADKVIDMTDVWVFSRDVKSRDPRWFVVETRDDVVEVGGMTLPEAKDSTNLSV
ncbi:MAG TPA: Tim44/TimA family putative adaptor protein [Alphaproteobacteria bacterium]